MDKEGKIIITIKTGGTFGFELENVSLQNVLMASILCCNCYKDLRKIDVLTAFTDLLELWSRTQVYESKEQADVANRIMELLKKDER